MKFFLLFIYLILEIFSVTYATEQDSTNFSVNVTIRESCDFSSSDSEELDFGASNRGSQNLNSHNNLNIKCTSGTPYTVELRSNYSMINQANNEFKIPYYLYQDANYTKNWNSESYTNSGTGNTQPIPVWGHINKDDTNVPMGNYSDTVIAIVKY